MCRSPGPRLLVLCLPRPWRPAHQDNSSAKSPNRAKMKWQRARQGKWDKADRLYLLVFLQRIIEIGDYCGVSWSNQDDSESDNGTRARNRREITATWSNAQVTSFVLAGKCQQLSKISLSVRNTCNSCLIICSAQSSRTLPRRKQSHDMTHQLPSPSSKNDCIFFPQNHPI
jgi:hypothetical protein